MDGATSTATLPNEIQSLFAFLSMHPVDPKKSSSKVHPSFAQKSRKEGILDQCILAFYRGKEEKGFATLVSLSEKKNKTAGAEHNSSTARSGTNFYANAISSAARKSAGEDA